MPETQTIIQVSGVTWLPTNPPRPCPPLLTLEETAMLLRCKEGSIRYYVQEGKLRGRRVGRFLHFELDELLKFIKERPHA